MNLKFLPIGSVCLINSNDKKHMIIGYNQNNYEYVSVLYPEGINQQIELKYFNHDDVVELFSLGYKGNEYNEYNSKVLSAANIFTPLAENNNEIILEPLIIVEESKYEFDETGTLISENEVAPIISNLGLQFDENGVVISDSTTIDEPVSTTGYQFDANGVVIGDNNVDSVVSTEPSTGYQFDENGIVIGDWTATPTPEKPNYVYDENGIIVAEKALPDIGVQSYQFDENGIVIGDWTTAPAPEKREYVYDENGIIISDGMGVFNQPKLDIQYNEDGIITSDGISSISDNIEPTLMEEVPVPIIEEAANVQFDENGMVITNEVAIESNLDMPSDVQITMDSTELPDIEQMVEPKKEEKKKKGFFGFGK